MAVSLTKSELQVCTNYTFSCRKFHSFVLRDQKLIDAVARNNKYKWKNITASFGKRTAVQNSNVYFTLCCDKCA